MNILFGHYVADEGNVEVFGKPLPPGNPRAALAAGVGMVHQHFTLADNLSVMDNPPRHRKPVSAPAARPPKPRLRRSVAISACLCIRMHGWLAYRWRAPAR